MGAPDLLNPERARKLLAAMAQRDFDRIARGLRVSDAARRGIRVVPASPGPEFQRIAYACDARPHRCAACAQECTWYRPSAIDDEGEP